MGGRPDAAEPAAPPTLFVAATTDLGALWLYALQVGSVEELTPRLSSIDVLAKAGAPGAVKDVEIQSLGSEVVILGRVGPNVHVASVRGDAWTGWRMLASDIQAMGLANVDGSVWSCLVGQDGHLRLMSRGSEGRWEDHGDVMDQASIAGGESPDGITKLDCTGIGSALEVFALDRAGLLWRAAKTASTWIPFRRVPEAGNYAYVDVDTCNAGGDLHVLLSETGTQYHAVRPSGGNLSGFSNVEQFGDPMGSVVAGAEASLYTDVEWLQLNSLGEIWFSSRAHFGASRFAKLVPAAPDERPFVSLSATGVLSF
jgi:hypothetical protein